MGNKHLNKKGAARAAPSPAVCFCWQLEAGC
jgi:hypothetical protein